MFTCSNGILIYVRYYTLRILINTYYYTVLSAGVKTFIYALFIRLAIVVIKTCIRLYFLPRLYRNLVILSG